MSDEPYAPPAGYETLAASPLEGLLKGLAITAIVLGVLGLLQGAVNLIVLLNEDLLLQVAASQIPPSVRAEYDDMMLAAMPYQPLNWLALMGSLAVSALMTAGGVVALVRRSLSLLAYGALGAAIIDVVSILVQVLVRVATNREWEAYSEAVSRLSGGSTIPGASGIAGMTLGLALLAAFAVFWGWAFIRIRESIDE